MEIGNIIKSRIYGTNFNETPAMCVLHFFCGQVGIVPFEMDEFNQQLEAVLVSDLAGIMSIHATIDGIESQNLHNILEYHNLVFSPAQSGLVSGLAGPSKVTFTFKKHRPYPPLRNGYFRSWGVPGFVLNGNSVSSDFLPEISAVADALITPILDLNGYGFTPVVLRNQDSLPPVPGQAWTIPAISFNGTGTQNTRD